MRAKTSSRWGRNKEIRWSRKTRRILAFSFPRKVQIISRLFRKSCSFFGDAGALLLSPLADPPSLCLLLLLRVLRLDVIWVSVARRLSKSTFTFWRLARTTSRAGVWGWKGMPFQHRARFPPRSPPASHSNKATASSVVLLLIFSACRSLNLARLPRSWGSRIRQLKLSSPQVPLFVVVQQCE